MIGRREFIRGSALGAGALLLNRAVPIAYAAANADSRIEVLLNEPLGTISPDIYGHFTSIWVG